MQIQYFYSILFIELVNDNFICRYGKEWFYGKLISEAYDIISVQAQTHHSTVYLVRHKKLDVLRTAKFVRKDTGGYMRILREADFLKILRHSGIPLIYDIAEDKDSICIIEEFISGKSLTEYVAEHRMLTAAQITDFVLQICDILEYLHSQGSKGMVHLDLKPDNILIYATSNRRHLIRETWSDRNDVQQDEGMHRSDTMQEKLSLVYRFGVRIYFGAPNKKEFQNIVKVLAEKYQVSMDEDTLLAEANKWELSHGGLSGRTAQQFINYLLGKE